MDAATLDRELGLLVRKAINSGMEPIIVLGFLSQNAVEVALHSRKCAEERTRQSVKSSVKKAFEMPPQGTEPDPTEN
jgi:hypothetical protein